MHVTLIEQPKIVINWGLLHATHISHRQYRRHRHRHHHRQPSAPSFGWTDGKCHNNRLQVHRYTLYSNIQVQSTNIVCTQPSRRSLLLLLHPPHTPHTHTLAHTSKSFISNVITAPHSWCALLIFRHYYKLAVHLYWKRYNFIIFMHWLLQLADRAIYHRWTEWTLISMNDVDDMTQPKANNWIEISLPRKWNRELERASESQSEKCALRLVWCQSELVLTQNPSGT